MTNLRLCISLVLLTIGFVSHGQLGNNMNSTLCQNLELHAKQLLEQDSVFIPSIKYGLSGSAKKILELDYHLTEMKLNNGDLIPNEMLCFDEVMDSYIKEQYGKNFFDNVMHYADSLDNIKEGYIAARLIGYYSIEECFRINFKDKQELLENEDLMYVISLEVNEMGKHSNITYYKGSLLSREIVPLENDSVIDELQRVLNTVNEWTPATLRKRPIKEKKVVLLSHLTF